MFFLECHLKKGYSRDASRDLRIYFFGMKRMKRL